MQTQLMGNRLIAHIDIEPARRRLEVSGRLQSNPMRIFLPDHGLAAGDPIRIASVEGMTDANADWTVYAVTQDTITINTDATGFGAYTTGDRRRGECVPALPSPTPAHRRPKSREACESSRMAQGLAVAPPVRSAGEHAQPPLEEVEAWANQGP